MAARPGEGATREQWAAHGEAISTRPAARRERDIFREEVEDRGPLAQLRAAFKALLFALRAYQDGVCGAMVAASGNKPGAYASMHENGLKKAQGPHGSKFEVCLAEDPRPRGTALSAREAILPLPGHDAIP